jgi:hypothetical protein
MPVARTAGFTSSPLATVQTLPGTGFYYNFFPNKIFQLPLLSILLKDKVQQGQEPKVPAIDRSLVDIGPLTFYFQI